MERDKNVHTSNVWQIFAPHEKKAKGEGPILGGEELRASCLILLKIIIVFHHAPSEKNQNSPPKEYI